MSDVRRLAGSVSARGVVANIAEARARVAAAPLAPRQDSAGFSPRARELARAGLAVRESPEARAEKINALRTQIRAGYYRPDPRAIARSILEHGL